MNNSTDEKIWFKTETEIIKSLLADDAKNSHILEELAKTVRQLKAKNTFRLALLNTLLEKQINTGENK